MYEARIFECSLRDGYHREIVLRKNTLTNLLFHLRIYFYSCTGEENNLFVKFERALRRVERGTSKGVKIFYSKAPGYRIYLFIELKKSIAYSELREETDDN